MAEKINQIEINGTTYDLQDKDAKAPFTGTLAEAEEAIASGDIKEGDIVNITDDTAEKFDTLNSYEEIMANTENDKIAGAIGVKEGFQNLLGDLFIIKSVSKQQDVAAGATYSTSLTLPTVENYKPIAVAGFNIGTQHIVYNSCFLNNNAANVTVKSIATATATAKIVVYVLYVKSNL